MPSNSTHRDASNGGIIMSTRCHFDRFRFLDFLIETHILIENLFFSWDTERMDIRFVSVASKRFGSTNYQPISSTPSHENIIHCIFLSQNHPTLFSTMDFSSSWNDFGRSWLEFEASHRAILLFQRYGFARTCRFAHGRRNFRKT